MLSSRLNSYYRKVSKFHSLPKYLYVGTLTPYLLEKIIGKLLTQTTVRRLSGEEKWRYLLLTEEGKRDGMKCQSQQRNCCKIVVSFNTRNYYYRNYRVVIYLTLGLTRIFHPNHPSH